MSGGPNRTKSFRIQRVCRFFSRVLPLLFFCSNACLIIILFPYACIVLFRMSVPTNMLVSGASAVSPECLVYFLCLSDALPMCFMCSLCFPRARSLQFYAFVMLGLLLACAVFMRFLCVCCSFLMAPSSCARAHVCVCVPSVLISFIVFVMFLFWFS